MKVEGKSEVLEAKKVERKVQEDEKMEGSATTAKPKEPTPPPKTEKSQRSAKVTAASKISSKPPSAPA